jgi:putative transposase
MELYGYCIMTIHIHLIFRSANGDPSGLIRDFKGFTSRKMLKEIEENPQKSRKQLMLWMFERSGKKNSKVKLRQFWQQNNKSIEIWSLKVFEQKLNYIHNNPVETGFVINPIDWKYSSARNYGDNDQTVLEININ